MDTEPVDKVEASIGAVYSWPEIWYAVMKWLMWHPKTAIFLIIIFLIILLKL
jgi:hypothetical protein